MFTISRWLLFKKMGYKGWTYLIPFYNFFCVLEALYGNGWLILTPLWIVLGWFGVSTIGAIAIEGFQAKMAISMVTAAIAILVALCLVLKYLFDLTHAFGKRGWWTLATVLFYPIMLVVYGISDLKFQDLPFPDEDNYDALDGFLEFFRNQKSKNSYVKEVKRCKKCGAELRDNTVFCSQCGTRND